MSKQSDETPYHYVAYIDEAGDPGLNRVKPRTIPGSSEWLILSAVVINATNEPNVVPWVRGILKDIKSQRRDLHFTDLRPWNKSRVCDALSKLPARYFVVCSNKKNMQGHRNPFAEKYPSPNWFYAWMSRLLLERVTYFVRQRSLQEHGSVKRVRLEFSERGGLTHASLNTYFEWLRMKSAGGVTFLPLGDLAWDTMHRDLLHVFPHKKRAGLQLSDSVASAFFKACDKYDTGECDPRFARALGARMARDPDKRSGRISGYGVKLMPQFKRAELLREQAAIFRYYGYPGQWWAPTPSNSAPLAPY